MDPSAKFFSGLVDLMLIVGVDEHTGLVLAGTGEDSVCMQTNMTVCFMVLPICLCTILGMVLIV